MHSLELRDLFDIESSELYYVVITSYTCIDNYKFYTAIYMYVCVCALAIFFLRVFVI